MNKKVPFKDLTPENIEYIKHIYYDKDMSHEEKMDILTDMFGIKPRTARSWWIKLKLSNTTNNLPDQLKEALDRSLHSDTSIVFATAAQNKTGINKGMLKNMEVYANKLTAMTGRTVEIVIAPSRYRNPTSPIEENKQRGQQWWVKDIEKYLFYNKVSFGDTLISCNSRILPTAKKPLNGYEVLAKDRSLVLPHSRVHFKTLPRFKNATLRSMSTTGFITKKNYSDSKAGETAYQHHSYGFVIIEKKKDGTCHIPRNVRVNYNGDFSDLIYEVKEGKVSTIKNCKGIILGDLHSSEIDRELLDRTLDLYDLFKPKITVVHDVLDASTTNPHETKDMFIQRLKIRENRYLVDEEIKDSFKLLSKIKNTALELKVIISNHDIFLDRYVNDRDWKKDLHNSPTYLKMALIQQTVDIREFGSIYGYMLNEEFKGEIEYINYGESFRIGGYECGMHADFGVNGARGSATTFSKLNTKMIGGHSHSPVIEDGYTAVGLSSKLNQYYNRRGLSSWAHCHSIIHNNDKNQLLVFGNDYKFTDLLWA